MVWHGNRGNPGAQLRAKDLGGVSTLNQLRSGRNGCEFIYGAVLLRVATVQMTLLRRQATVHVANGRHIVYPSLQRVADCDGPRLG